MKSANPSCSISNREFLDPKKKKEIESRLGDSRIVDSLDGSNKIEYFDTFPTIEELEYHEWLLKYLKPSWVKARIRTGNLNNIKIFYKMDHFLKRKAYIDLESPINEEGMVTFKKDDEKITFKMPHKMEASNCIDFKDINTDSIPPFVLGSNDDRGKTYYSNSLTLGPEYREDESISKEIQHLMKLEREAKRHKGEVTLYLMRRSLEVLRKFHWMILGGRFNQLSHVSSPLLSNPEEY
ncbi:hypothetical protein Tco_1166855 [Tanacetum coccineum]